MILHIFNKNADGVVMPGHIDNILIERVCNFDVPIKSRWEHIMIVTYLYNSHRDKTMFGALNRLKRYISGNTLPIVAWYNLI